MKKTFVFVLIAICSLYSSCATFENLTVPKKSVAITESPEAVNKKASKLLKSYSYIIRLSAVDRFDKAHRIIILDEQYFQFDGKLYAYKFDSLMRQRRGYTALNGNFVPFEKEGGIVGFTGYATSIDNPENSFTFILSRFLASAPYYTSAFDAYQKDRGIYFSSPPKYSNKTKNGVLQKATYFDYFPILFYTDEDDVLKRNLRNLYIVIRQQ